MQSGRWNQGSGKGIGQGMFNSEEVRKEELKEFFCMLNGAFLPNNTPLSGSNSSWILKQNHFVLFCCHGRWEGEFGKANRKSPEEIRLCIWRQFARWFSFFCPKCVCVCVCVHTCVYVCMCARVCARVCGRGTGHIALLAVFRRQMRAVIVALEPLQPGSYDRVRLLCKWRIHWVCPSIEYCQVHLLYHLRGSASFFLLFVCFGFVFMWPYLALFCPREENENISFISLDQKSFSMLCSNKK